VGKEFALRHLLIVTALAAGLVLLSAPGASGIVYGQSDGNLHPNVGALVIELEGETFAVCSGTLISPTIFLTAAHCTSFTEQLLGSRRVLVTFDPVFSPSGTFHAGTTFTHPDFGFSGPGGRSDPHDIAVVELDSPVSITPAQLPRAGLLDELQATRTLRSQTFTAVGYGAVRETRRKSFENILPNDERRFGLQSALSLQKAWLTLSMNQATGNAGTCYGDSGGPHFLGGVESSLIVSLTVTGDAPCKATDVTYRLDTASARAFLSDFVDLP
jgi:secreted trypsin-like serine protease